MRMVDWIDKLDQFLQISEKELLHNAGTVSADDAARKASEEFEKYRTKQMRGYISDFDKEIKRITGKSGNLELSQPTRKTCQFNQVEKKNKNDR